MVIDIPTVAGPNGRIDPDWSRCEQTGGARPSGAVVMMPGAADGMVRVRVRVVAGGNHDTTVRTKMAQPTPPPKRFALCVHESEPYTPEHAARLGLNPHKTWKHCGHPELPKGTANVCSCMGCGTRCPGFVRGPAV